MNEIFKGELLLLSASKNRVTFAIGDPNPFRNGSGRFMGAIVAVGDDEISPEIPEDQTPVELEPGALDEALRAECREMLHRLDEKFSPIVTYAVMLCKDHCFRRFIKVNTEPEARAYILGYCRIASRSEIANDGPRHKFSELYKNFKDTL